MTITPFRIEIPQTDLDDLHARLDQARWPRQLPGDGWSRGVPVDYLTNLAHHWRHGYDWREHERRLNVFPQYTTEIDGLIVHFLHVRNQNPQAPALILTHGWPNSIVEFTRTIDLLAEHFHVVVPSVPGFGFSEAPKETGFSTKKVGQMWAGLMQKLGYERYGAQGGDLGAYIAQEVAKADPERVIGVHIDGGLGFPDESETELTEDERSIFAQIEQWSKYAVDHHTLLRVAPQTFSYGWHDSPVGLLGWLMQKFQEFTPTAALPELAIDRDQLLTNASIYWFTGTAASSSWFMYDNTRFHWPTGQNKAPTGVYHGAPGIRRLAERTNDIVRWGEGNPGGHFVAMEEPEAHAADIIEFFGKL
ncbi:epoxide hydrolase family protein [Lentzea terrae]|uniref:epoxide hydrolase family protein n=1 Tax=Lentzea terrae TaxID=2200761 RepID=UPI000DD3648F|nr:epoxide hydrolase family protein [Lentzea terrae]